ncbi:MAG: porin [Burkholderiaceae bacterium]|nr:porin [Burkholderiaceae bacterium]
MKKTLLAVAVAAALPAAAFAQVTLYGVADMAVVKATGVDAQLSSNGGGNNGTSRIGVRGTEDLGGGLKASFNFEQAVNIETGATEATTFQRAAWVGLSGGFGSVRLGRSLSPSFYGVAAWELTGTANYSVTYGTFGAAGGNTRNNSEIAYTTPNMSGFSATIAYVAEADNGGPTVGNRVDGNVTYRNGPLVVAGWYNENSEDPDAGYGVGGKYNFGMFTVAGSYQSKKTKDDGFTLGAATKLGPVALVFDVARINYDLPDTSYTNYLLEAKYPLSKATFMYATYLKRDDLNVNQTSFGMRHNF